MAGSGSLQNKKLLKWSEEAAVAAEDSGPLSWLVGFSGPAGSWWGRQQTGAQSSAVWRHGLL